MVNNNRIPRGYRNETHLPKRNSIYMGYVRRNFDAQRMGRLLVWISDFGPDDVDYWLPMSYASPFAGATPVDETKPDGATMEDSQQTYGWWATPPDRDNQVLCCFLDGDIANGYWFACVYPQNMNHMIPGIGGDVSTDASMDGKFAGGPPVVEYNRYDSSNSPVTSNTLNSTREQVKRPVFTPLADALIAQGLTQDVIRGAGNTSARRESPSRVHGFLTPRGNGWQIDDGALPEGGGDPENEMIRFRTRNGVQIMINDTEGFIYMITKAGKSWVEISDSGIDMWSAESISMASEKDVNISAGGKIGLHGNQAIYMASAFISSFSDGDTNLVANGNIYMDATRDIGLKSSRDVCLDGVRDVTANAGRNILDGACGVVSRNGRTILDNSGGAAPPEVPHAKFERNAVNRVPTHEPFDRTGKGTGPQPVGVNSKGQAFAQVRTSDGVLSTVPVNLPAAQQARAKLIYAKLKARGFSDVQCSAIIGVWIQESSLNPGATEGGGGQGYGLAQWSVSGGRRAKLVAYAQSVGKPTNDLDMQLDFFVKELNSTESRAGSMLRSSTTLNAALAAMKQYERYGEVGKRAVYAQQVYASIRSGGFA